LSFGRIIWWIVIALVVTALVWTGVWQYLPLFLSEFPMLTWLPLLALVAVGFLAGAVRRLVKSTATPATPTPATGDLSAGVVKPTAQLATLLAGARRAQGNFWWGPGLLAGLVVLLLGVYLIFINPPAVGLDAVDYTIVNKLPAQTQPRLLPRTGITDDPAFRDSDEIHLVRDPDTGELVWSGEWQGSLLGGESEGVAVKPLDDVVSHSRVIPAGFDHSVHGITPSTLKGKAKLKHPFSKIQYPVVVPSGKDGVFAMAPYVGYSGFPLRYPYLKGVLVYHQDGEIEDLTPEEAASRPELVATGRIFPESVARSQAEAIARSDQIDGEINDAEDNKQPYLTSIDGNTTDWITIIDSKGSGGGVKALVLADSSTGETQVWLAPPDHPLLSTQYVINQARAMPLRWEEERCCDSDGNSYTVKLRQVVEPRLAFKDGHPYYLVTIVPTDDLTLGRDVEYTLIIDAETGKRVDLIDHVQGGVLADARLQGFFISGQPQDEGSKKN
jgi:hypothetical protein